MLSLIIEEILFRAHAGWVFERFIGRILDARESRAEDTAHWSLTISTGGRAMRVSVTTLAAGGVLAMAAALVPPASATTLAGPAATDPYGDPNLVSMFDGITTK
jgi:hypothetical protein